MLGGMAGRHLLYRGDVLLGALVDPQPDFPWVVGAFEPSESFEAARPLFERSMELLDAGRYDEWEEVWTRIAAPGLRIQAVDPADGQDEEFSVIHIRGDRFQYR
jgi:hypothetical protein